MTKIIINADIKRGKINRNIYGHFRNTWVAVFTKAFGWERIHPSPIPKVS